MYPLSQYHVANCGLRIRHEVFLLKKFCYSLSLFYITHPAHSVLSCITNTLFDNMWTFLLLESS